jgi:glycosyltransferase involved in cell wall biosynthesis
MKKLSKMISKLLNLPGNGISLLVPAYFPGENSIREKNWDWLKKYWEAKLPGAEIIIGSDPDCDTLPFSKSVAVNNAARQATGDIFVIIDADVLIDSEAIIHCAKELRLARKQNRKLWFVPYRKLFRLTVDASNKLLETSIKKSKNLFNPPTTDEYLNQEIHMGTPMSAIGHWYGAMIQIVPREGFESIGGWDTRFRGWGAEDHATVLAVDTLFGPHKTLSGQILHIWHPVEMADNKNRLWPNQNPKDNNLTLFRRYNAARGNPIKMRKLVDEPDNKKPQKQSKNIKNSTST